jgi:ABC-2 type transport system ATP-binding protein
MPQERGLYPGMRAGDQVVYYGRLHGLSRRDAEHKAKALLEELGLADRWDERTETLSGGMQQRLQLATALVHDPDVIVLDEPFAGLDPVAVASLS